MKKIRQGLVVFTSIAAALFAQSESPVGTISFGPTQGQSGLTGVVLRARVTAAGTAGEALVTVRALRGGSGDNPVNVVEFTVDTAFAGAETITAMRVLRISDDRLAVDSAMTPFTVPETGRATFTVQKYEAADPSGQKPTVEQIVANPTAYRIELQTRSNAILRSALSPARQGVAAASLVGTNASATAFLLASVTRDAACVRNAAGDTARESECTIVAGQIETFLAYRYPAKTLFSQPTFTSLVATDRATGAVLFDAQLPRTALAEFGVGDLRYRANITTLDAGSRRVLQAIALNDPSAFDLTLYSTSFAAPYIGGAMQGTTRVQMAGPIGADASSLNPRADAVAFVDLLKNPGTAGDENLAGLVTLGALFENYPAGTRFTELVVRPGPLARPGPVTLNSGLSVASPQLSPAAVGFATGTMLVNDPQGLRVLNDFVASIQDVSYFLFLGSDTRSTISGRIRLPE